MPGREPVIGDYRTTDSGYEQLTATGWVSVAGYYDTAWFDPSGGGEPPKPVGLDMVNHPPHYKFDNGVEVIALTEQLNFNCGNAVKYLARAGRKSNDPLEDLQKAEFYVKREIARVKRRS